MARISHPLSTLISLLDLPSWVLVESAALTLAAQKSSPRPTVVRISSSSGMMPSELLLGFPVRLSDNIDITQRPFYYHHLHASPHDGDELWVLSNKLWQSLDGGKKWIQRSGTKDDFHDLAFDPRDPDRMIITHDGGAMVTLNRGKTWSTPFTQPNQQ